MAASIFTRPTRKKVSRAPASNARSTSATQTGSKPAAFTASATSASLPAKTTNGGLSTSSFAAARSPSKSTAKPSSNTTNLPSLLKAAANASARAHSPYKPMTPKASSATKTSASNAWTSESANNYSNFASATFDRVQISSTGICLKPVFHAGYGKGGTAVSFVDPSVSVSGEVRK